MYSISVFMIDGRWTVNLFGKPDGTAISLHSSEDRTAANRYAKNVASYISAEVKTA